MYEYEQNRVDKISWRVWRVGRSLVSLIKKLSSDVS